MVRCQAFSIAAIDSLFKHHDQKNQTILELLALLTKNLRAFVPRGQGWRPRPRARGFPKLPCCTSCMRMDAPPLPPRQACRRHTGRPGRIPVAGGYTPNTSHPYLSSKIRFSSSLVMREYCRENEAFLCPSCRCTAATLPVFSIMNTPMPCRAECGVLSLATPAKSRT